MTLSCFKAYDIRGKVPSELNVDLARRIGRAYAARFSPKKVVVGYDMAAEFKGDQRSAHAGADRDGRRRH